MDWNLLIFTKNFYGGERIFFFSKFFFTSSSSLFSLNPLSLSSTLPLSKSLRVSLSVCLCSLSLSHTHTHTHVLILVQEQISFVTINEVLNLPTGERLSSLKISIQNFDNLLGFEHRQLALAESMQLLQSKRFLLPLSLSLLASVRVLFDSFLCFILISTSTPEFVTSRHSRYEF